MPGYRVEQGRSAGAGAAGRRRPRAALARAAGPLLLLGAAFEGSACAMQSREQQSIVCSVEASTKAPPELQQEGAICGPIARAAEAAARDSGLAAGTISVKVEVLSPFSIAATTSVEGRALPTQRVDVSDRALGASSIEMLARGVALQLAQLKSNRA